MLTIRTLHKRTWANTPKSGAKLLIFCEIDK